MKAIQALADGRIVVPRQPFAREEIGPREPQPLHELGFMHVVGGRGPV